MDLGLTEGEFWELTPDLLARLSRRWEQGQEREDYRAGVVASTIVGVMAGKKVEPREFFGKKRQQSPEELRAIMSALANRGKGKKRGDD